MIRLVIFFLTFFICGLPTKNLSMQSQLMQRHNAGENESEDVKGKILCDTEKNFSHLTIKDIQKRKCPVCLEKLKGTLILPPCHHCMHESCFRKMRTKNFDTCGVCRVAFELNQERTVNCCSDLLEDVSHHCFRAFADYPHLLAAFLDDLTNPNLSWSELNNKFSSACQDCTENYVTF